MSSLKTACPPRREKAYWRSLDELADRPEFARFAANEFPAPADEMLEPASRRTFLKMMSASLALAGMTACRWPREEILPFAERPEGFTPGEPLQFATALELAGVGLGVLVTSYDGRPIKIEGNPLHPSSLGATSAVAQAAVLELYDPDRSRSVVRREGEQTLSATWDDFTAFAGEHFARLRGDGGASLRVLAERSASPGLLAARQRLERAFPRAVWHEHEPVSYDAPRAGARLALGRPYRTQLALDRAEVIVAFDEDLLLEHPAAVRYARDFVAGRGTAGSGMSRIHVFESAYSLTGARADRRYPLAPAAIPAAAACLAAKLVLEHGLSLPPGGTPLADMLRRFAGHPLAVELDWSVARELAERRGRSLIVAGPRQPPAVHALVHLLNEALGNAGETVAYTPEPDDPASIADLARDIADGRVGTLVILGGNPAYDAPADLDFERRLGRVPVTIHLGLHRNETAHVCTWHLPRAHALESWGDTRDWRGRYSATQPLIEPLYGGRTSVELLALLLGETPSRGRDILRATFAQVAPGPDLDHRFSRLLHDGLLPGSEPPLETPAVGDTGVWAAGLEPFLRRVDEADPARVELAFLPAPALHDGRFANNGWLQELPDPLTKLTWDNAALVGPSTAARLGVRHEDVVRLVRGERAIDLPVYVMPGQAAGSMTVHLGYGRRHAGRVGDGVGVDAYALRTTDALHAAEVRVEPTGATYVLATTQNHYAMDPLGMETTEQRAKTLVREVEFAEHVARARAAAHGEHEPHEVHEAPLWKPFEYDGYRWGMAIDLNACTGCNACVVACQAENNIAVVGKAEVGRGREMHWIRIDRYFSGDVDAPGVVHQPVTCQHCENAPCEQVCPVAATVHDHEGLNVMVYNRCVGTRYCANNCPYKVRRFNFFNHHKHDSALEMMVYNPEVTVRSRGVMEKCSFCVQRINRAKIDARNARRTVRDGEITPACAQACPTRAIAFGDLNDADSAVAGAHADARAYSLLDWLYVEPRTRYLERLSNGRTTPGEV